MMQTDAPAVAGPDAAPATETNTPAKLPSFSVLNFTDADELECQASGPGQVAPPTVRLVAGRGPCRFQFDMHAGQARQLAAQLLTCAAALEQLQAGEPLKLSAAPGDCGELITGTFDLAGDEKLRVHVPMFEAIGLELVPGAPGIRDEYIEIPSHLVPGIVQAMTQAAALAAVDLPGEARPGYAAARAA